MTTARSLALALAVLLVGPAASIPRPAAHEARDVIQRTDRRLAELEAWVDAARRDNLEAEHWRSRGRCCWGNKPAGYTDYYGNCPRRTHRCRNEQ